MQPERQGGPPRPGTVLSITSFANPRVKAVAALHLAKHRRDSGLFLGEGLKLVTDALERDWPVAAMIYAAEATGQAAVEQAAATARARGADILIVSAAILAKVTRRDNPQTVVGVFRQRLADPQSLAVRPGGIVVALEGIKDPGNLGTIVRTVDAVGGDGVILVGDTVDPFGVEAVRATMGSLFHVPLARMTFQDFLAWRERTGATLVGTHLAGERDYREPVDAAAGIVLVMGNEQSGLSERLAAACDRRVRIPMAGGADSLNLAVATGVMLYELRRAGWPAAGARP